MYPDPKSVSRTMYNRALASLPGGNTRTTVFMKPYPIYAARGEGCRVWDVDGNEFIDCINNFTSLIHGHAHPSLIEAATRQLSVGSRSVCRQNLKLILQNCSCRDYLRSSRCDLQILEPKQ
jgi:glutamate-1-semialdehyde 2,1-aminomutase